MADEKEKSARKAAATRKKNRETNEALLVSNASVKAELKALKRLITKGWTPPPVNK